MENLAERDSDELNRGIGIRLVLESDWKERSSDDARFQQFYCGVSDSFPKRKHRKRTEDEGGPHQGQTEVE